MLQGGGEFPSLPFVPPDVLVRMHSQYSDQAALLDANDARHVEYHGDDGDFQVPYGAFTAALLDPDQVRAQHAMLLTERGGFWKCCVPCRRRAIWKFYRTQNDLIEALADAYTGGPEEEEADEETTLLARVNQSSTAAAAAAAAATTPPQPPPTEDDVATFAEDPDALVDGGEEGGAAAAEKSTKEAANDEEDCPSGSVVPPSTTSAAAVAVSQEEASKSCCARACACWSSPVDLMVNISFAANVLLLVIKVIAAVWSGSLSVIASTIDSFLDLFSGSIIFATNCLAKRRDVLKFPVGRTRLEPLGVLIFSAVMAMSMASILIEGAFRSAPPRRLLLSCLVLSLSRALRWSFAFPSPVSPPLSLSLSLRFSYTYARTLTTSHTHTHTHMSHRHNYPHLWEMGARPRLGNGLNRDGHDCNQARPLHSLLYRQESVSERSLSRRAR